MAVNLVTVTGNLETLIGATPTAGRLWFKLNRPDWNDAGEIFAPEYVEAVAETDGSFTIDLQSTADFENGATYSAILKYFDPTDGKPKEFTLSTFALPTGGPFQLGDLLALASGGGALLEFQFANRAALVAKVASGLVPIPGFTYFADGLAYLGQTGATAIPDLHGLVPAGDVTILHFALNASPGVTDLTSAIGAAASYMRSIGGGEIYLPRNGGPYAWSSVDLSGGVSLIGDATDVVPLDQTLGNMISASGVRGSDVLLTSDLAPGATTLEVGSTAGFASGDWIDITDDNSYSPTDSTYKNGERARVLAVTSGTVLTLYGPVLGTINGGSYTTANSAKINKVTLSKQSKVVGLNFVGDWNSLRRLVLFSLVDSPVIENNTVSNHGAMAFRFNGCVFGIMTGNTVNGLRDDTGLGHSGYAFVFSGPDLGSICDSNASFYCRHGFTTLGGQNGFPRGFVVSNNTDTHSTTSAFDTHAAGSDYQIIGNSAIASRATGISLRAPRGTCAKNLISRSTGQGINIAETNCSDMTIEGNTLVDIGSVGINASNAVPNLRIHRNQIIRAGNRAIRVFSSATTESPNLRITDNLIEGYALSSSVEGIVTGGSFTNTGALISGNSLFAGAGTPTYGIRTLALTNSSVVNNIVGGVISTAPYSTGPNANEGNRILGDVLPLGFFPGYGAGASVTQATSKATGVTVNANCGVISTSNATLSAGAGVIFTVTNSLVSLNDVVSAGIVSPDEKYTVDVVGTANGSFKLRLFNFTAGDLSEAVLISFAVINGATS